MATTRVLKFPRSDDERACVLVQVTCAGSRSLDLKLLATEGDAPYACVLKHERVASLRVKNCPVSEQEWERILGSLLHQKPVEGIQATATVQSETSILLTVRKEVQGITQRLGAITLTCNQDEQIELFQWCEACLDILASRQHEAVSSAAKVHELEAAVADLQAQLDELVRAKQDDETALLHKFRDLLNEKKVRIREQQKIIAASALGPDRPASPQLPQAEDAKSTRRPAQSRPAKRKAEAANVEEDDQDDDGQAEDDNPVKVESEDTDPGDTSDGTASAIDDDDDQDADVDEHHDPGEANVTRGSGQAGGPAEIQDGSKRQQTPPHKAAREPPPPRNLPFTNRNAAAPNQAEEGTDSDDEL